jgi:hypothetical protein
MSMVKAGNAGNAGRADRVETTCRPAPVFGLRLAVFLDFELGVDRFYAFGIARNLNGFVGFRLAVGRTAQPDDAILVGIDLDVLRAGRDARRPAWP